MAVTTFNWKQTTFLQDNNLPPFILFCDKSQSAQTENQFLWRNYTTTRGDLLRSIRGLHFQTAWSNLLFPFLARLSPKTSFIPQLSHFNAALKIEKRVVLSVFVLMWAECDWGSEAERLRAAVIRDCFGVSSGFRGNSWDAALLTLIAELCCDPAGLLVGMQRSSQTLLLALLSVSLLICPLFSPSLSPSDLLFSPCFLLPSLAEYRSRNHGDV